MSKSEKLISSVLEDRIKQLEEASKIQNSDGNWNYDPYMHGLANGLIFSISVMKEVNPNYLKAPKKWLKDK